MPDTDAGQLAPFEQAALDEIARVRRELDDTRRRRRAAEEAFDAFLKSFRRAAAGGGASDASGGAAPREAEARGTRAGHEATAGRRPAREPLVVPPAGAAPSTVSGPTRPAGVRRVPRGALFGLAAVLLAATVVLIPRGREVGSANAVGADPVPIQVQEPVAAAAAASQPQPPAAELVALRRVWVRVTVDGERVLERELPADTRVPLGAGEVIVVRAGDGGAVRLSIHGADQGVLGVDGQVITRTFTVGQQ